MAYDDDEGDDDNAGSKWLWKGASHHFPSRYFVAGAIVTWFIVALSVLQCCLAIDKAHQAERRKNKGKEKKKDRRPSGTLSMKLRRRKKNETPKKPSMTPSGIVDYGQPPPATYSN